MPSGTTVTAKYDCYKPDSTTDKDCYLEVAVFPLAEDFDHSEGLCGNYNKETNDDRVPKGSRVNDDRDEPIDFTNSYMSVNYHCCSGLFERWTNLRIIVRLAVKNCSD